MSGLLACLRRRHLPRVHRGPRAVICLRCLPCTVCGSPSPACVGWCATTTVAPSAALAELTPKEQL